MSSVSSYKSNTYITGIPKWSLSLEWHHLTHPKYCSNGTDIWMRCFCFHTCKWQRGVVDKRDHWKCKRKSGPQCWPIYVGSGIMFHFHYNIHIWTLKDYIANFSLTPQQGNILFLIYHPHKLPDSCTSENTLQFNTQHVMIWMFRLWF